MIRSPTRGSRRGWPASGPSKPWFHSAIAGISSQTVACAPGPSRSSAARRVKPMPRPPISTRGASPPWRRRLRSASTASDCQVRFDISSMPLKRISWILSRRRRMISSPASVEARASSVQSVMACPLGAPGHRSCDRQEAVRGCPAVNARTTRGHGVPWFRSAAGTRPRRGICRHEHASVLYGRGGRAGQADLSLAPLRWQGFRR